MVNEVVVYVDGTIRRVNGRVVTQVIFESFDIDLKNIVWIGLIATNPTTCILYNQHNSKPILEVREPATFVELKQSNDTAKLIIDLTTHMFSRGGRGRRVRMLGGGVTTVRAKLIYDGESKLNVFRLTQLNLSNLMPREVKIQLVKYVREVKKLRYSSLGIHTYVLRQVEKGELEMSETTIVKSLQHLTLSEWVRFALKFLSNEDKAKIIFESLR